MAILRMYDKMIDLVTAANRLHDPLSFRLSPRARARMAELIVREEIHGLSSAEALELDLYLDLTHAFVRLRTRGRRQFLAGAA